MPFSVIIVDDHALIRQGIRAVLESDPDFAVAGEAADGLEAVRLAERLPPDLLILDFMMPGLNGMDVWRIVRQRSPQTRVVMVTMYDAMTIVSEAIREGVWGYVLKGGRISEILTAARAAMAGQRYLSPPLSERDIEEYLAMTTGVTVDPCKTLTPRQRQVFQLAAEGNTCPQIAVRLHISERTVEMHRSHLMRKLQLKTQTELVRYALQRGIL